LELATSNQYCISQHSVNLHLCPVSLSYYCIAPLASQERDWERVDETNRSITCVNVCVFDVEQ